ncbi:hypothetical protein DP120_05710 [Planococcus halotolerans]|uniref:Uncharacterized protein n=1 Tax=Planococcus halotolerans TaxID=2233542 RepID=A0A365L0Z7_9BACL|nr:hypothetical protein DP120_05710 [Planococcus halotolerans]
MGHLFATKLAQRCRSSKFFTIWRSGIFLAAQPKWLTTRGVGRWSLDNRKCDCARLALKGIRQNNGAAFFAAELGWLMIRRAGPQESGHQEKRKRPLSSDKRRMKKEWPLRNLHSAGAILCTAL